MFSLWLRNPGNFPVAFHKLMKPFTPVMPLVEQQLPVIWNGKPHCKSTALSYTGLHMDGCIMQPQDLLHKTQSYSGGLLFHFKQMAGEFPLPHSAKLVAPVDGRTHRYGSGTDHHSLPESESGPHQSGRQSEV